MLRLSLFLLGFCAIVSSCSNSIQSITPASKIDTIRFSSLRISGTAQNYLVYYQYDDTRNPDPGGGNPGNNIHTVDTTQSVSFDVTLFSKHKTVVLADQPVTIVFDSTDQPIYTTYGATGWLLDTATIDPVRHEISFTYNYGSGVESNSDPVSATYEQFRLRDLTYSIDSAGSLVISPLQTFGPVLDTLALYHVEGHYGVAGGDISIHMHTFGHTDSATCSIQLRIGE